MKNRYFEGQIHWVPLESIHSFAVLFLTGTEKFAESYPCILMFINVTRSSYPRLQIPSDTLKYLFSQQHFPSKDYYFFHISQPAKICMKNRYFEEQFHWVPLSSGRELRQTRLNLQRIEEINREQGGKGL